MKKNLSLTCAIIFFILTDVSAQSWSLTGNSGTSVQTNYLGTNNAQPLEFRVNNQKAAFIDYNLRVANTTFGYEALLNINGGSGGNSALGYKSLYTNTSGSYNTAAGLYSLNLNTTGASNTASGVRSLFSNTTGSFNTAFGNRALTSNTTGNNNIAAGNSALYNNTTGYSNVAIGASALYSSSFDIHAIGIGDSALFYYSGPGEEDNVSESDNIAIGSKSLYSLHYGTDNTAIGFQSLFSNGRGYSNVAIGNYALYNDTQQDPMSEGPEGSYNTAVGIDALYHNTIGNDNTAMGIDALAGNTTGTENVAFGSAAGDGYNGGGNTLIGAETSLNNNGYYSSSALGYDVTITASEQARVGTSATTSIGGYVGWSNISDGRVKKNIEQNVPGLAFINQLQPITYNLDLDAADKIIQRPVLKDKNGKSFQPSVDELAARTAKQQIVYTGFIAQDVEKAAKSLNYDFSGVDAAKNSKDLYGLRYAEFVVPLVKAVQELSNKNDSKDSIILSLQSQMNELKAMMQQVLTNKTNITTSQTFLSSASLDQNTPNPFKGVTTIGYTLPQTYTSAQIIVRDNLGKTLKAITVSGTGKGSLNVDAATLSGGAYNYSLLIDGSVIDTRQMVLAK